MIKEQNIPLEKWDNLIILDACRFDFFKKVYKDYLDGNLQKRISKGSNTGEWLVKTFPNRYDYTYISANPYINSYGIPLNKCQVKYKKYSWNAIEHFYNIIDVWEFGWDKMNKTIPPNQLNLAYYNKYKDNNRIIIHYMQPHYPYLSYGGILSIREKIKGIKDNSFSFAREKLIGTLSLFLKLFSPRMGEIERLQRKIGIEKLLYYYEDNLRIVLRNVLQLIEKLDGRTIITADHGEAFGEQGVWGHPLETHVSCLIEVPWLEIEL